ncbi:lachrymatory-factor synthase-like [Cryptomeria japonica]|uniref:lachrymatory-factor synthase-like n=1 Tax=Cryptomeria japonica TaxID=3369 RepID=UPI0027DA1B34|nr:lachrymatory-factor synthase-like [Cryptomeria japonica]
MAGFWKLSADFVNVQKYGAHLIACEHVEGEINAVGCVRLCRGPELWAKEKLVAIDPLNYSYTYQVIDCNFGIEGYTSTFNVENAGDGDGEGNVIEWRFDVGACKSCTKEEFVGFISSKLEQMIQGLDEMAKFHEP